MHDIKDRQAMFCSKVCLSVPFVRGNCHLRNPQQGILHPLVGNSIVRDVLLYGDRLKTRGLNLLSAPGNDLVASTALAAAGCQIVLFTTGRGTPFGTFVPTAKISTNSTLAANKPLWIDFNAGEIVDGRPSGEVDEAFVDFVLGIASGELTNNEKSAYSEIAIFKSGVTL